MSKMFNIVQIWIEDPDAPDDKIKSYMNTIIDNKPDGATYTLVSTKNYFPKNPEVKWIDVKTELDNMSNSVESVKKIYKSINSNHKSQLLRMYMAGNDDNMVYFDCNIELKGWPEEFLRSGKPLMHKFTVNTVDNFVFVVNSNKTWFKIMTNMMAEFMLSIFNKIKRIPPGTYFKILNRNNKDFQGFSSDLIVRNK